MDINNKKNLFSDLPSNNNIGTEKRLCGGRRARFLSTIIQ